MAWKKPRCSASSWPVGWRRWCGWRIPWGEPAADEFVALMPDTGLADAERVRKRVVGVLHQSEFRLTDNVPVGIEVYVQSGIAELQENDTLENAITRASDLLE